MVLERHLVGTTLNLYIQCFRAREFSEIWPILASKPQLVHCLRATYYKILKIAPILMKFCVLPYSSKVMIKIGGVCF